jgi:hypothetical protein
MDNTKMHDRSEAFDDTPTIREKKPPIKVGRFALAVLIGVIMLFALYVALKTGILKDAST